MFTISHRTSITQRIQLPKNMLYAPVLLHIIVVTPTTKYVNVSSSVTMKYVFVKDTTDYTCYISKHLNNDVPHVHDV
jgi:hypothetical protein